VRYSIDTTKDYKKYGSHCTLRLGHLHYYSSHYRLLCRNVWQLLHKYQQNDLQTTYDLCWSWKLTLLHKCWQFVCVISCNSWLLIRDAVKCRTNEISRLSTTNIMQSSHITRRRRIFDRNSASLGRQRLREPTNSETRNSRSAVTQCSLLLKCLIAETAEQDIATAKLAL